MGISERMKLVNSIEKIFFDHAFQIFNEKHPGASNRIKDYLVDDEDYLVKYYTTLTKSWLTYINPVELQQILMDKMSNEKLGSSFSGNGMV